MLKPFPAFTFFWFIHNQPSILQLCFCFGRFIIVFVCVFSALNSSDKVCCVCFVNWLENAAVTVNDPQIYEPHLSSYHTCFTVSSLSLNARGFTPAIKVLSGLALLSRWFVHACPAVSFHPSVCLRMLPPSHSLWQIYRFMTSWNWTLVLLKPMSRNKINSFSLISCSFCAYNTDNVWIVNHILKHSKRWWSEQEILEKIQTWH